MQVMNISLTQTSLTTLCIKLCGMLTICIPIWTWGQTIDKPNHHVCPPAPLPLDQQKEYIEKAPAKNAGFLWRVEKDSRISWLYGTMHLSTVDYAKPGTQIMQGMRQIDVFAAELHLNESQPNTPVNTSRFVVADAQLIRLRTAYQQDCVIGDSFSNLLPVLVLSSTQAQREGLFPGYSPDLRLLQIAQRTSKPIVSLENLAQQNLALTPASQQEFNEILTGFLDAFESGELRKDILRLHQLWRENDWPALIQYEREQRTEYPAWTHRMLDERNTLMARKIDTLHQQGQRVFVAVGALHMVGENGLPKLLDKLGYTVRFIPLKN